MNISIKYYESLYFLDKIKYFEVPQIEIHDERHDIGLIPSSDATNPLIQALLREAPEHQRQTQVENDHRLVDFFLLETGWHHLLEEAGLEEIQQLMEPARNPTEYILQHHTHHLFDNGHSGIDNNNRRLNPLLESFDQSMVGRGFHQLNTQKSRNQYRAVLVKMVSFAARLDPQLNSWDVGLE